MGGFFIEDMRCDAFSNSLDGKAFPIFLSLSQTTQHPLAENNSAREEEESRELEMETTSFLRNRYWVLRHGKSIPNERGLIVSSMVGFLF